MTGAKIRVVRLSDGSFAVEEDGEFTYGGGLSYEAARRIADQLKAGAVVTDTEPPEPVEYNEPDDENAFNSIGYRRG
jgi:hypothetical protein